MQGWYKTYKKTYKKYKNRTGNDNGKGLLNRFVCADWPEYDFFKHIRDGLGFNGYQYGKKGKRHTDTATAALDMNSGEELHSLANSLLDSNDWDNLLRSANIREP